MEPTYPETENMEPVKLPLASLVVKALLAELTILLLLTIILSCFGRHIDRFT
jgi:hypothetical protein